MSYDIHKWAANEMARRPRRRHWAWAILAGMAFTLVLPAVHILVAGAGDRPSGLFFTSLLPLMLATFQSPFARDSWLTERRLAMFDEFERAALTLATRRAYSVLMALVVLLFGWLALGAARGWPIPGDGDQWLALGISLIAIGGALPVFFAELLVPVPPDGDDDDEG